MSHVLSQELRKRFEQKGKWIEDLFALFEESILPDKVFHLFACACAERALQRESDAGREPASASLQVLETKQAWLRDEVEQTVLSSHVTKARSAAHLASVKNIGYEAATSAADAASEVAYAVRAGAWALAAAEQAAVGEDKEQSRELESRWQMDTFLRLVEASQVSSPKI